MFVCEGHRVKVKITGTKSLSVCLIRALTFECFLLECYFWCASTHSECLKSDSYIKVIGSRSRSQEQKTVTFLCLLAYKFYYNPWMRRGKYFWYAGTSSEWLGQVWVWSSLIGSRSRSQAPTILTYYLQRWLIQIASKIFGDWPRVVDSDADLGWQTVAELWWRV